MMKNLLQSALALALFAIPANLQAATLTLTTDPAAGQTVRSISDIKVSTNLSDTENVLAVSEDKVHGITITKEGDSMPTACVSAQTDVDKWPMNTVLVTFNEITEAGTYTLHIPAGTITESAVNWDTGAPDIKDTDATNADFTVTYTVDPEIRMLNEYTFSPANGSELSGLSYITMSFDKLGDNVGYDLSIDSDAVVTLSNGTTTYNGSLSGWGNNIFISFTTEDGDELIVTESGMWQLQIPAGAFTYKGESSDVIAAFYVIDGQSGSEGGITFEPANGSKIALNTEYATHVYFNFDATEVTLVNSEGDPSTFIVNYSGQNIPRRSSLSEALGENGGYFIQSYDDEQLHFIFSPLTFTNPGVLTISSEEGDFTVDGNPSPAIEYSINVGDVRTYTYSITPASGSEIAIDELNEILISFPEAKSVAVNEDLLYAILRTSSWISPTVDATVVEDAEIPTVSLKFAMTQSTPGRYSLVLDEGSFTLDGNQRSPSIEAYWTVVKTGDIDTTVIGSPEKKILNESYGFNGALIFAENESISRGTNYSQIKGYVNDTEVASLNASMESNYFMFYIDEEAFCGIAGTFRIESPEGAFTISGTPSPAFTYEWELVTPKEYTLKFKPADGSKTGSLEQITLEIVGAKTVAFGEYGKPNLRKSDYSFSSTGTYEFVEGQENATVRITFNPAPTTAGKYTLNIGYGSLMFDGAQANENITATFDFDPTYTGIDGVDADAQNDSNTVYTIDGRCVATDAPAASLKTLAPGFYIINGKKTFVK